MDQSGLHAIYGRSSMYSAEIPSWSGRDPAICRPRVPSSDYLIGFPLWNSFCFICPCSALTRHYQHYSNFFPVTSLISSHEWVHWRIFVLSANFIFEGSLEVKLPTIWTNEKQRWEESEKRGEEERRSKKRKSQKKEDPGAWKGRKVAKHFVFPMICGSGGSRSRLAKAVGAEPAGQMRDEKLHAVVARSTFRSQKIHRTAGSDHFLKLRCRKSARRCDAKRVSKSKC